MNAFKPPDRVQKLFLFIFMILAVTTVRAHSQETASDYNRYYRFPLSVGVEYQKLSPFDDFGSSFNVYEIAANIRWPIPSLPMLQPTLRLGMINFDSHDAEKPEEWDHRHYYGGVGILYTNRFTKNFEIGAELLSGYSQAVFPDLVPEEGSVGTSNLIFELGTRVGLNPSYNFSIDVHPNLKYLVSLNPLDDFDGLIFGIGFSAHYRFGQDPDSQQALIRSIRFDEVSVEPLFSAMQSYYVKSPVGAAVITNTEKHPITDVNISFFQAGFMDSPTPSGNIPELGPGETRKIDLFASFNQEVFRIEGVTPLTGEVIVSYASRGKPAEQRRPVSYDLFDKTAIIWDDNQKAAAFITPADSALRNYTSFIRQACKDDLIPSYNEKLQIAIQIYEALGEIGLLYQADPTSPFTSVQDNPMAVDSISLPRDTLQRITGDCDDLTVLYNSLLETVGVETGYITTPGHIFSVFNTTTPSRSYGEIHPERNMTININGELWLPVEITIIGRAGFLAAWRRGVEEWHLYSESPERRGLYTTRSSQQLYRSVGLKETDLGLQYGNIENIQQLFKRDMTELVDLVVKEHADRARNSGKKSDFNKLGITYAQFSQYAKAERAFQDALAIDPDYLSALANLGNIAYMQADYETALSLFEKTLTMLQARGKGNSTMALKVLINISRTHYEMKQYERAKEYFNLASSIDASETEKYAYIKSTGSGEARAFDVSGTGSQVLFLDSDE